MRRLARRFAIGCAVGVVAVVGAAVVGSACLVRRTSAYIYDPGDEVPARAWAIVLGARVKPEGEPSDALRDRLETARGLFADGHVRQIFVSGDGHRGEDAAMEAWLVAAGVPPARIVRDPRGFRTRATMENAAAHGIREAVVCTQRFHLPRAVAWARHLDIDAIGYESPRLLYPVYRKDRLREAAARTMALVEMLLD
ncbi:MAG: YdcF family protein [Deltaproteobacteria bacterium]|nr:YdcF family protein [Deltaproteobacteria bacterium]